MRLCGLRVEPIQGMQCHRSFATSWALSGRLLYPGSEASRGAQPVLTQPQPLYRDGAGARRGSRAVRWRAPWSAKSFLGESCFYLRVANRRWSSVLGSSARRVFWFRFGSSLVQVWFRFGSSLVQVWFRSGSGLAQVWFRFGSGLVQVCFRFRSGSVQVWFM